MALGTPVATGTDEQGGGNSVTESHAFGTAADTMGLVFINAMDDAATFDIDSVTVDGATTDVTELLTQTYYRSNQAKHAVYKYGPVTGPGTVDVVVNFSEAIAKVSVMVYSNDGVDGTDATLQTDAASGAPSGALAANTSTSHIVGMLGCTTGTAFSDDDDSTQLINTTDTGGGPDLAAYGGWWDPNDTSTRTMDPSGGTGHHCELMVEVTEKSGGTNDSTSPATVAATGGIGTVTTGAGTGVNAAVVAATGGIGTVTTGAGTGMTATTVAATGAIGTVTTGAGAGVDAATIAAIGGIGAPSISSGWNVTATTVAAIGGIGTATAGSGADVTAAVVAAIAGIGAPTLGAGTGVDATTVAAIGGIGTVTIATGWQLDATTVAAVAGIGTATLGSGTGVIAVTVDAVGGIGAPTLAAGSQLDATTVAAIAGIGTPTVAGSNPDSTSPATVIAIAGIGTVAVVAGILPITARSMAAFWRIQEDGVYRLMLHPEGLRVRMRPGSEGWEQASDFFLYNTGEETFIMQNMEVVWPANQAAAIATLKSAINTQLNDRGYRGIGGATLS